jgi:hypothetical protein
MGTTGALPLLLVPKKKNGFAHMGVRVERVSRFEFASRRNSNLESGESKLSQKDVLRVLIDGRCNVPPRLSYDSRCRLSGTEDSCGAWCASGSYCLPFTNLQSLDVSSSTELRFWLLA